MKNLRLFSSDESWGCNLTNSSISEASCVALHKKNPTQVVAVGHAAAGMQELVGDIFDNGIQLTGGGALRNEISRGLSERLQVTGFPFPNML